MMKSPTSLIRIRYAVGVMLALSAVFAVVISTISMPGDRAAAQIADATTAVDARAAAWWDSLTPAERTNAIFGKEYDHDTDASDDDPAGESEGRQLPPEASGEYSALGATGVAASGTPPTGGTIGKDNVDNLVDGNSTGTGGDIYAVGEEPTDVAKAIRGFQSVELWWDHLTCVEARIAVGEDNNALLLDADTVTADNQPEVSAVCDTNPTGDPVTSIAPTAKAYSDVKAIADEAGQAILGLSNAGNASHTDARAKQWWDALTSTERLLALYGIGTSAGTATVTDGGTIGTVDGDDSVAAPRSFLATLEYDQIRRSLTFHSDGTVTEDAGDLAFPLDSASMDIADGIIELINDRWRYIYAMGGSNDMGISELVYWWDSIGNAQRRIAAGVDNEQQAAGSESAATYDVDWDELNPLTAGVGTAAGEALEEQVFEVGQAILFTNPEPLPNVAEWWNTLNADQMVYVVYGNPPMRTAYDPDLTDTDTTTVTTVTDADKAVFQKMYDGLADDDGIRMAAEDDDLSTHLPAYVTEMLARNGMNVVDTTEGPDGDDADTDPDYHFYSAKAIVNALANEIFDPPAPIMAWVRPVGSLVTTSAEDAATTAGPVVDDEDFDWPYNAMNKAANVGDWWETLDCRVMRIAVGEDNNYLNGAVAAVAGVDGNNDGDFDDVGDTAPVAAIPAETSVYCAHFPGHDTNDMNDIGADAQKRAVVVGAALLNLTAEANGFHAGRPSFNEPATGTPTISGVAQVGAPLMSDPADVADTDGLGDFSYQWLRDGEPINGANSKDYTLQPGDVGAAISVRYSFTDGGRYYEMRPSNATSIIAGSPGEVSRIEPTIRSVTVSAGDEVTLSVDVYGLQNAKDNSLGSEFEWSVDGTADADLGSTREIDYTAPSSPGTYTVTAMLGGGQCQPEEEEMRESACSASITVRVRRPSAPVDEDEDPVNPPGPIPTILTDSDGNQYEVFTPVDGGTFTGENYSISGGAGVIPNGEVIGIRMSDEGAASNVGMTHQRYTIGGNMYAISAVDSSEAPISSYVLSDAATVCVPLPAELRTNISDVALVVINSDDSLTILAGTVNVSPPATVCGSLSSLPAKVAVGAAGAPAPIPTPVPEPTPEPPATGGAAPASGGVLWALVLGLAVATLGSILVMARRRESVSREK